MPFVFWNVSEVNVDNFYIRDPPLWSLNIMNGTNMRFNNIYANATAVDAPYGDNWVQNTDGFGEFRERTVARYQLMPHSRYNGCRKCPTHELCLSGW